MTVKTTIADGKISAVEIVEQHETAGVADKAISDLPAAIVTENSVNVDTISGLHAVQRQNPGCGHGLPEPGFRTVIQLYLKKEDRMITDDCSVFSFYINRKEFAEDRSF